MSTIFISDASGNRRVYAELADVNGKTRRSIRQAWFGLGKDIKSTLNRQILDKASKTGREYKVRSRTGRRRMRKHQASAPGQTHANMFGDLRKSRGWKVHGWESMEVGYGVSPRKVPHYAPFVEYGTPKMEPRPSVANAIESERREAEQNFDERMHEEFNQ
jgi:HK97 gp10 family phage protein